MATTALRFSSGGITSTFTAWMHVEPTQTSWLRVSCLVKNALPACGAFTGSMVITPGDAANIRLRGTAKSILPAGATRQDGGSGMRGGGPCDLDPGDRDVCGRVRPPWMACRPSRILSRTQHPVGGGSRCGGVRVARASRQKDSGGGMLFNATRGTRAPLTRRNSPSEPQRPPGSLEWSWPQGNHPCRFDNFFLFKGGLFPGRDSQGSAIEGRAKQDDGAESGVEVDSSSAEVLGVVWRPDSANFTDCVSLNSPGQRARLSNWPVSL